jgi:hypothetical protein
MRHENALGSIQENIDDIRATFTASSASSNSQGVASPTRSASLASNSQGVAPPSRPGVDPVSDDWLDTPTKRARLRDPTTGPLQPTTESARDGITKLYIRGYEFTRSNVTKVKISYRCSFYRSQGCAGKLQFYADLMEYDFANAVPHTCTPPAHARQLAHVEPPAVIVRAEMQRVVDGMAIADSASPQQIWDAVSKMFYKRDDDTVVRGLTKNQVTKRVHHVRAMHFGADLHGRVEVPPLSLVKNSSMNFFQFHHVWTTRSQKQDGQVDRVIGWAHPSLLMLLRYEGLTLFIDGTFRCVPAKFHQCIVAMVYDRGTQLYIPVCYVLASSKSYETYWNAFQYIADACGEKITPKEVVCDFEIALINAVMDWFPDADVIGCYFHFKQACKRKMGKLYIPTQEICIAMSKGVLDMLTIVDPVKIRLQGIAWVSAKIKARCGEESIGYSSTKWDSFWKYLRKTWLVLLPPKLWNVYGIKRDLVARTNNPLERFNRELNSAFSTPRPSVPKFVQTIEEMSRRSVKLRDDIAKGLAKPPPRPSKNPLPVAVCLPDAPSDEEDGDEQASELSGEESQQSSGDDGGVAFDADSDDAIVSDAEEY